MSVIKLFVCLFRRDNEKSLVNLYKAINRNLVADVLILSDYKTPSL